MATQVQFRRGTASQNNAFTGAQAELTVDTDVWALRIHDGTTAGGRVVPTLTATQTMTNKTLSTGSTWSGNAVGLGYGGTGAAITPAAGAVVYSTGSALAVSLAGTSGQVLTSGGTSGPTWVNASSLTTGTATSATTAANILGGSAGYLVYQVDTNQTGFIAPGTSGYILKSTGASTPPSWVTSALTIGSTAVSVGTTVTDFDGITSFYLTGTTDASSSTTGVLRVAGGASVAKKLYVGSDLNVTGNTVITGNLTVNGTTTTLNSTTLTVDDINIELGAVATPTDTTANGGGILLYGATNKTITWDSTNTNWTSSEHWNIASGKSFKIANTSVLSASTVLGSATSVTAFGSGTTIAIGASTGTLTLNNPTVVGANTTQNLFNTVATTLNIGGAATTVSIGAATGITTVNNSQFVHSSTNYTKIAVGTQAQRPGGAGGNPGTAAIGMIRYNTDISSYEGYASGNWSSLGGVKSVDGYTYIIAETTAGASNGELEFYAEDATGTATTKIGGWNYSRLLDRTGTVVGSNTTQNLFNTVATTLNIGGAATTVSIGASTGTTTINNPLNLPGITHNTNTTQSTAYTNGSAIFDGGVGIAKDLRVGGTIYAGGDGVIAGNITLTGNLTVSGTTTTTSSANAGYASTIIDLNYNASGLTVDNGKDIGVAFDWYKSGAPGYAYLLWKNSTQVLTYYKTGTLSAGVVTGTLGDAEFASIASTALTTAGTTYNLINTGATTLNIGGASTATTIGATTGTTTIRTPTVTLSNATALNINGASPAIATTSTTASVFNSTVTTLNIGQAATTVSIGASTGTTTINNDVVVTGNITVNGTTTTINATTLTVNDKNIELGKVASPTNTTADGGGITLKGTTDKTIIWDNANSNWTSSENWNIATGKTFKINNVDVLTSTAVLGTGATITVGASATSLTLGNATAAILTVNPGTVVGANTTQAVFNTVATTVNAFGAATAVTIGASTGTTTIATPTVTLSNATALALNGAAPAITTTSTSASVFNATVTTLTIGGAATSTTIGSSTSATLTLNPGTIVGANTTQTLFNTVATTVNAFGAATTTALGYSSTASSTMNFANGATATGNTNTINIGNAGATGSTTNLAIGSTAGGTLTLNSPTATGSATKLQIYSLGVNTAGSSTAGEIRATGDITSAYSDDRLKTRKGNIENALEKVLSLDGFYYEANEVAQALGYEAKPQVGLSAQQVQAVLPEIVVPAPIDEQYLTVNYERIIPLLVEAIKEQQKQIEELKAKLGN